MNSQYELLTYCTSATATTSEVLVADDVGVAAIAGSGSYGIRDVHVSHM